MILFILMFVPFINDFWYVTAPELIYLICLGIKFLGPWGLLVWPLYTLALAYNQTLTMVVVAVIAAVQVLILIVRNFAGDRIAKDKKGRVDNGENGVPRMTGANEDAQRALDRMKTERDTYYDQYADQDHDKDDDRDNDQSDDQDDDYGYDSCPVCGSDDTDGNHCYGCDEDF